MENVRNVRKFRLIQTKEGIKYMKKLVTMSIIISSMLLSACSTNTKEIANSDRISVVATSFYEYDWIRQILGDNQDKIDLTLLLDNGVDLHSYEPSVEDISKITSAALFIHTGGDSDSWVDDVLEQTDRDEFRNIDVMEYLGDSVKKEVMVEGMQGGGHDHDHEDCDVEDHDHEDCDDEDHDHDHEDHDHEDCDEEGHADEHIWLSLKNAIKICDVIEEELSEIDPDNASIYEENKENYINSLVELDEKYAQTVKDATRDTVIFADRFPFLYMMQDYGINYYAAFQGCSAETEASFETVAFLSDKVKELSANNVIVLDNGLAELGQTIINNSGNSECEILTINAMESITGEDIENGVTYLTIMEENLEILKTALN